MKRLEQWRRSTFFIVICERISILVLIVEFGQVNVCWVHMEKTNTFNGKIE